MGAPSITVWGGGRAGPHQTAWLESSVDNLLFSHSVVSVSLQPHRLQHTSTVTLFMDNSDLLRLISKGKLNLEE